MMTHRGCGGLIGPDLTAEPYEYRHDGPNGEPEAGGISYHSVLRCARCRREILGDADIDGYEEWAVPPRWPRFEPLKAVQLVPRDPLLQTFAESLAGLRPAQLAVGALLLLFVGWLAGYALGHLHGSRAERFRAAHALPAASASDND